MVFSVFDMRQQRLEQAAEQHKLPTSGRAAEFCIAADALLKNQCFDALCTHDGPNFQTASKEVIWK